MNRYATPWNPVLRASAAGSASSGGLAPNTGSSLSPRNAPGNQRSLGNSRSILLSKARNQDRSNAEKTLHSKENGHTASGSPFQSDTAADEGEDTALARARVEATLLIAKTPLNNRKLAQLARLEDATQARTLVNELNQHYEKLGRAIRIENVAGGNRLMTRAAVAPWLRRLGFLPPAIRLSWPMMETLAIVAYRQDVTRADVEAVRGVACGEILRQLMQLELVRISGRSEDLGRPYLYGTTKRFLKICGLASINSLPVIDWRTTSDDLSQSSETTRNPIDSETASDESSFNPVPHQIESASSAAPSDPKESDVSIALTDTLATELSPFAVLSPEQTPDGDAPVLPAAVIEDEEDDLYEKGQDDDEDEDFVDDDDDWDDDDDEDDDLDDDESDDDEDELDEDETDEDWEEVDDDEADEDWDDDDEEDDDWDDDDEEEEEDEDWEE